MHDGLLHTHPHIPASYILTLTAVYSYSFEVKCTRGNRPVTALSQKGPPAIGWDKRLFFTSVHYLQPPDLARNRPRCPDEAAGNIHRRAT